MSEQIKLRVLYFAKLGDEVGCTGEQVLLASGSTLTDLTETLTQRGEIWKRLNAKEIRCAINQTICKENLRLHDGDEIAFFPPVTGG